jgi:hypothetical protein
MKVYHGSYVAVDNPEIYKSKFAKDFGEGFYCTPKALQTIRFVESKTKDNYDR